MRLSFVTLLLACETMDSPGNPLESVQPGTESSMSRAPHASQPAPTEPTASGEGVGIEEDGIVDQEPVDSELVFDDEFAPLPGTGEDIEEFAPLPGSVPDDESFATPLDGMVVDDEFQPLPELREPVDHESASSDVMDDASEIHRYAACDAGTGPELELTGAIRLSETSPEASPPSATVRLADGRAVEAHVGSMFPTLGLVVVSIGDAQMQVAQISPNTAGTDATLLLQTLQVTE